MYKVSALYLTLGIVVSLGCVSSEPNVFQAPTLNAAGCSEIEYRWESEIGIENEFYPGAGGFCTQVNQPLPQTFLEARCVERNEAGEVIWAGRWVKSVSAPSREQFLELCRRFE